MKKALPFLIGAVVIIGGLLVAKRMGWLPSSSSGSSGPSVLVVPGETNNTTTNSKPATNTNDVIASGINALGSIGTTYLETSAETDQTKIWAESRSSQA